MEYAHVYICTRPTLTVLCRLLAVADAGASWAWRCDQWGTSPLICVRCGGRWRQQQHREYKHTHRHSTVSSTDVWPTIASVVPVSLSGSRSLLHTHLLFCQPIYLSYLLFSCVLYNIGELYRLHYAVEWKKMLVSSKILFTEYKIMT